MRLLAPFQKCCFLAGWLFYFVYNLFTAYLVTRRSVDYDEQGKLVARAISMLCVLMAIYTLRILWITYRAGVSSRH